MEDPHGSSPLSEPNMAKPALDNTMKGNKMIPDSNLPPAPAPLDSSSMSSSLTKGFGMDGGLGKAKSHLKKHAEGKYHKSREM